MSVVGPAELRSLGRRVPTAHKWTERQSAATAHVVGACQLDGLTRIRGYRACDTLLQMTDARCVPVQNCDRLSGNKPFQVLRLVQMNHSWCTKTNYRPDAI